jgi:hypothetical protein
MRAGDVSKRTCCLLVLMAGVAVCGADESKGRPANEVWHWVTDRQPMLADVTGDGMEDLIGWLRVCDEAGGSSVHLSAVDAATGQLLWSNPETALSQYTKVALVGGRVLLGDSAGMLTALTADGGRVVWRTRLGERVARFCGESEGRVRVEKTDDFAVVATLASGELSPVARDACAELWTDQPGHTPRVRVTDAIRPEISGLSVSRVLIDEANGVHVAIGSRKAGTGVPMAARFVPPAAGDDDRYPTVEALWLSAVPAVDPLTVHPGAAERATLSANQLLAPYQIEDAEATWRLACLDLESGRSLWDVAIRRWDTTSTEVDWLMVSGDHVLAGLDTGPATIVQVLDLATGQLRMTLGQPESAAALETTSEPVGKPSPLAVASEESRESPDDAWPRDETPLAAQRTEERDRRSVKWSIPDGVELTLGILSTSSSVGHPVVARIERAPDTTGLPKGTVLEGRVIQIEQAGEFSGGSLTVVFDHIALGGRGLTGAMEPVAARFKVGGGTAWLNRALMVGCTVGSAVVFGHIQFASLGLSCWCFTKDAKEPVLTPGERRTVRVRKTEHAQR